MNDEITVDIKDLLLRICLKWRLILIWMLAGCVLFSGYGLIQSAREVSTARHRLEEQMAAGGPIEGEELIIVPKLQIFSVKNIVIGLIGGAFVICFWLAIRYVVSSKLRVKEDLPDAYGITLLGSVWHPVIQDRRGKKVDQWILRLFRGKEERSPEANRIEMLCTDLRLMIQEKELKKIYLTTNAADPETKALMETCYVKLKECAELAAGGSIVHIPESLEALASCDGAVFFEHTGITEYDDIQKGLVLCERHGVSVLGGVVVES